MASPSKSLNIELITDSDYLKTLLYMLEKAQHDIEVLAFSFAIGSINGRINKSSAPYKVAEKLVELKKTKKHLNIRVYMEGVRSTSARNFITSHFLEEAGIIVEFGATHAKGFCVDHHLTLVGSTNLTNQSLVKNYEANLLIDDVDVAVEFHRYFEHLWAGGQHGRIRLHEPLIADGDFEEVLLKMIRSAQKTLEFSIYFFDHKKIYAALIEAHERGVHIKGFGLYHPRFALSYVYRTRRTIEGLRKIGVTDLHFSNASNFAHSKYLIKDRTEVLLGTGNWLKEDVEIHPQLHIHVISKKLSTQLLKHLNLQISQINHLHVSDVQSQY